MVRGRLLGLGPESSEPRGAREVAGEVDMPREEMAESGLLGESDAIMKSKVGGQSDELDAHFESKGQQEVELPIELDAWSRSCRSDPWVGLRLTVGDGCMGGISYFLFLFPIFPFPISYFLSLLGVVERMLLKYF